LSISPKLCCCYLNCGKRLQI